MGPILAEDRRTGLQVGAETATSCRRERPALLLERRLHPVEGGHRPGVERPPARPGGARWRRPRGSGPGPGPAGPRPRPAPRPRRPPPPARARGRWRCAGPPGGARTRGCSCTTVKSWRVTSPCWPQPWISLWQSSGEALAKAGALAFSLIWVFHREAAVAPMAPPPWISGTVRPMCRARPAAGSPSASSASRRRVSWSTARSIHARRQREEPDLLQHHERRDGEGADAGPGLGDVVGDGHHGRAPAGGQPASSPPRVTATMRAPATAASDAASTVSSVSPENEMAKTSVPSPTKFGDS